MGTPQCVFFLFLIFFSPFRFNYRDLLATDPAVFEDERKFEVLFVAEEVTIISAEVRAYVYQSGDLFWN